MKRRRIFLHIGCSKSGTSSLQHSLYNSEKELLAQGVGLPLTSRPEHMRRVHDPLAQATPGEPVPAATEAQVSKLVTRLRRADGDRLLLTLEDLAEISETGASVLIRALADFEVHVVITARTWAKQIPSEWQHAVSHRRLLMPYGEYAWAVRENRAEVARFRTRQHVPEIARRWGADLPPDHIHVIASPPPKPDPQRLFQLFGDVVGLDPSLLVLPTRRFNDSLGFEQAETLRRVNVALGDRLTDVPNEYRPAVRTFLLNGAFRRQDGSPLRLPPEHLEWCREVSVEMRDELVRRGYDVVGDPDHLVPSADLSVEPIPQVLDSDVAATAVEALAMLVTNHQRTRSKRQQQQRSGQASGQQA